MGYSCGRGSGLGFAGAAAGVEFAEDLAGWVADLDVGGAFSLELVEVVENGGLAHERRKPRWRLSRDEKKGVGEKTRQISRIVLTVASISLSLRPPSS